MTMIVYAPRRFRECASRALNLGHATCGAAILGGNVTLCPCPCHRGENVNAEA